MISSYQIMIVSISKLCRQLQGKHTWFQLVLDSAGSRPLYLLLSEIPIDRGLVRKGTIIYWAIRNTIYWAIAILLICLFLTILIWRWVVNGVPLLWVKRFSGYLKCLSETTLHAHRLNWRPSLAPWVLISPWKYLSFTFLY